MNDLSSDVVVAGDDDVATDADDFLLTVVVAAIAAGVADDTQLHCTSHPKLHVPVARQPASRVFHKSPAPAGGRPQAAGLTPTLS